MVDIDQYFEMLHHLSSRGRKTVLVGSSYRLDTSRLRRGRFAEAGGDLSEGEIQRLASFLDGFERGLGSRLLQGFHTLDASFLDCSVPSFACNPWPAAHQV